jgi:hypothetical protein
MDGQLPFVSQEQAEVRRIASYTLKGFKLGKLDNTGMLISTCFRNFQLVSGLEYGDVYALPYSGGVFDQPYKTLQMWNIFKEELLKFIAQEQKKQAAKTKGRR